MQTDRPIVVDLLAGQSGGPSFTAIRIESALGAPPVWPTYEPDAFIAGGPIHVTITVRDDYGEAMVVPGSHPVMSVGLGRDAALAVDHHRVCDSRIPLGLDVMPFSVTITAIQRFSVPSRCEAQWVELAVPPGQAPGSPVRVSIIDLTGLPLEGPVPTGPFAEVSYIDTQGNTPRTPIWRASSALPPGQPLEPGHTYGLRVDADEDWLLGVAVTGNVELFVAAAGPAVGPWTPVPGALGFRLIGKQLAPTGGVGPTPSVTQLRVRLAPNPMRGALDVEWTGSGAAEVHVVDVSGRRVRRHAALAAPTGGSWTWDGRDATGRAVPAGVYFVRVLRTSGESAVERVVLMR